MGSFPVVGAPPRALLPRRPHPDNPLATSPEGPEAEATACPARADPAAPGVLCSNALRAAGLRSNQCGPEADLLSQTSLFPPERQRLLMAEP